jgi:hypothetical protein
MNMNRSLRIPLLSLAAALALVALASCSDSLSEYGGLCSVYAATKDCVEPNDCYCRPYSNCVCTRRCEQDTDCPKGSVCVQGSNPAKNTRDLFCFVSRDGGR